MLYYIFKYFDNEFNFPGAGVFNYISFRAGSAALLSLFISIFFGKFLIDFLKSMNIKDDIRDGSLKQNNIRKKSTPTMGGIIIGLSTIIPTLFFAKLDNIYIILLLITTLWMGIIGFVDDYIKVFKKDKGGLSGWLRMIGSTGLGIIVGTTLFFHKDVVVRQFINHKEEISELKISSSKLSEGKEDKIHKKREKKFKENANYNPLNVYKTKYKDIKSTKTNVPFFKNNELDYDKVIRYFFPFISKKYSWILYVLFIMFIISAVSHSANLTDGLDGLAASVSAIVALTLAILAYVSGNIVFSKYLNILYIPGLGELTIFCIAFVGACVGFLWYNTYPAQIFMGDTGSLTLGGVIAVLAISIRKELLIPILCGIFFIEALSVIVQVLYFKYTKKKYGIGKRIFKMAPLHHHFQQSGMHEAKIVARFLIVGILLAIFTLVTLKLR